MLRRQASRGVRRLCPLISPAYCARVLRGNPGRAGRVGAGAGCHPRWLGSPRGRLAQAVLRAGLQLGWWRHAAPDEAQLRVVVVHEGDALLGIAPFYAVRGHYRLLAAPVSARTVPLAEAGRDAEVATATAAALAGARPRPALVQFDGIERASAWPELLSQAWPSSMVELGEETAPVIALEAGPTTSGSRRGAATSASRCAAAAQAGGDGRGVPAGRAGRSGPRDRRAGATPFLRRGIGPPTRSGRGLRRCSPSARRSCSPAIASGSGRSRRRVPASARSSSSRPAGSWRSGTGVRRRLPRCQPGSTGDPRRGGRRDRARLRSAGARSRRPGLQAANGQRRGRTALGGARRERAPGDVRAAAPRRLAGTAGWGRAAPDDLKRRLRALRGSGE